MAEVGREPRKAGPGPEHVLAPRLPLSLDQEPGLGWDVLLSPARFPRASGGDFREELLSRTVSSSVLHFPGLLPTPTLRLGFPTS